MIIEGILFDWNLMDLFFIIILTGFVGIVYFSILKPAFHLLKSIKNYFGKNTHLKRPKHTPKTEVSQKNCLQSVKNTRKRKNYQYGYDDQREQMTL